MKNVYEVMRERAITLPTPPAKGGIYTPVQRFGEHFLYCSGCGPDLGNGNTVTGKLGKDVSLEDGQRAACPFCHRDKFSAGKYSLRN